MKRPAEQFWRGLWVDLQTWNATARRELTVEQPTREIASRLTQQMEEVERYMTVRPGDRTIQVTTEFMRELILYARDKALNGTN